MRSSRSGRYPQLRRLRHAGGSSRHIDSSGAFAEVQKQFTDNPTTYCTSSIDPWHSAGDANATGVYQHTGFDLFFTSGITNNLPAMVPVTMLYGTPDDSAGQIAYLEKRRYPIGYIEMGEEPDGKHAMPEDYAAFYIQWATALHHVDPKLKLGGPVFEGVNEDIRLWPDAQGRTSRMGRFIDYLKSHGRISDLAFVSFEHYPFEPCTTTWKTLYTEPPLMMHILKVWRDDGVPKDVPLMVTESHLANQLSGPMTTIFGGLWLADSVGSFLSRRRCGVLPLSDPAATHMEYLPRMVFVVEFRFQRQLRHQWIHVDIFRQPHAEQ